jgi:hypothetical protein
MSAAEATSADVAAERHSRRRAARLRHSHSYGIVLVMVVASFLFASSASDSAWTGSVLVLGQSATLVVALWTSGVAHTRSTRSIGLVAVSTAVAAANVLWDSTALVAATGLLAGALALATAITVAYGVADQREVNARSVLGAITVYVLLGMLFVFAYGAVATLGSGPFFAQGTDGSRPLRVYFSYVTLATLGYGDYTPAGNVGHTLAEVEALLGQLYLVTVVALLVSRLRR